jgi:SAM-dependent methyltransferase
VPFDCHGIFPGPGSSACAAGEGARPQLPADAGMTLAAGDSPEIDAARLSCPVCDGVMRPGGHEWLLSCASCGFQRSTLRPRIEEPGALAELEEDFERTSLRSLRCSNFERVLDALAKHTDLAGKKVLEVGCGYGWFLQLAEKRQMETYGIEPDPRLKLSSQASARTVWSGYFPADLPAGARFDIVVFNDSFEHLPDVGRALDACRELIASGGILAINLPASTGVFYRLGRRLDSVGIARPLERLWQKDFPSPHLSYFTPDQLCRLAARYSFLEIERTALRSVGLRGLWSRLRCDPRSGRVGSAAFWLGTAVLIPLSRFLPSDISLQLFRKG